MWRSSGAISRHSRASYCAPFPASTQELAQPARTGSATAARHPIAGGEAVAVFRIRLE